MSTQNVAGAGLQWAIPHTPSQVLHDVGFEYSPTESQSVYFILELSVDYSGHFDKVTTLPIWPVFVRPKSGQIIKVPLYLHNILQMKRDLL